MALTAKQRRFVQEYIVDLNATEAAKRAGYSERTAYSQGQRLLKNAEVQTAIGKAQTVREKRTGITADRVLKELARIGLSDIRQLFDSDGRLLRPEEWPDAAAAAVASIEVVTRNVGEGEVEHVAKIRAWDKPRALEMAGKHLGMFVERREVTGKDGGPIEIAELSEVELAQRLAALKS